MRPPSRVACISIAVGAGAPTGRCSQALSPISSPLPSLTPSPVIAAGVTPGGGDDGKPVMPPASDGVGKMYGCRSGFSLVWMLVDGWWSRRRIVGRGDPQLLLILIMSE